MLDDMNGAQMNLGLSSTPTGFSPVGYPTPPPVMSPGQAASNAVAQAQTMAVHTMTSGGLRPPPSLPGGDQFSQQYASQFQQGMNQIHSQMFSNPFYAQAVSRMSGAPGFVPGMMPSAAQFTDPSMGIFRPFPNGPGSMIPPVPMLPLIRTPFTPTPPAPRFQTPMEYNYNYQQMNADQNSSAALALPGALARTGVAWGGSRLGSGFGAAFGGMLGGPLGAGIGSAVGGIAGGLLAESGGFGRAAQHIVDGVNPARLMAMRGAQMQGMSGDFVVGGPGLAQNGTGWSRSQSIHAGRLIEDLAYSGPFRNETQRNFSVQDLTRITRHAGQQGMLDFAQTPEAMRDEVKKIATHLKTFMQIANEPDVREALKQMGRLRTMGFGVGEATGVAMDSKMFARMAGTNMRGLMETAGLPGAMMAQQLGLSAGVGLHIGQGMYGMARQAVAGGAYSVQDIAMLGGVQGIAQRNTEAALATLKMPMLSAAMSGIGGGGSWSVNPNNVKALLSGKMSIEDLARQGVSNMHGAIAQQGLGAMGSYLMDESKLQDDLGRMLGPIGTKQIMQRNILAIQRDYQLDKSAGGLYMAAQMSGQDSDSAKQFVRDAASSLGFSNVRNQQDVQRREMRALAQEEFDAKRGGMFHRGSRTEGSLYNIAHNLDKFSTSVRSGLSRAGQFFGEVSEDAQLSDGMYTLRTPGELGVHSELESAKIREGIGGALPEGLRKALDSAERSASPIYGSGALQSEDYKDARSIWGGSSEALLELKRRRGGLAGALVGTSLMYRMGNIFGNVDTDETVQRDLKSYDVASSAVRVGMGMSPEERDASLEALAKERGVSKDALSRMFGAGGAALAAKADANYDEGGLLGDKASLRGEDFAAAALKSGAFHGVKNLSALLNSDAGRALLANSAKDFTSKKGTEVLLETGRDGSVMDLERRNAKLQGAKTFLESTTESIFGEGHAGDTRNELMRGLSNLSPQAAMTAILRAKANVSGNDEDRSRLLDYSGTISQKDYNAGLEHLESAGDNDKYFAEAGTNLQRVRVEDLTARGATAFSGRRAAQEYTSEMAGVAKWKDAELPAEAAEAVTGLIDRTLSPAEARKKLAAITGARKNRAIEKFIENGDAKDLLTSANNAGENTDGVIVGGLKSAKEKFLNLMQDESVDTQKALNASFSNSVQELSEAARKLSLAARQMGMGRPTAFYSAGLI